MTTTIRTVSAEDRFAVSRLVLREFHATAAEDMHAEGIAVFCAEVAPDALLQRWERSDCYVFERDGEVVGYLDMQGCQLNMVFVQSGAQDQGVGTELVLYGMAQGDCSFVTVRALPCAVDWFAKLGFVAVSDWEERRGMRVLPMERRG